MRFNAPKKLTWWVSILLGAVGVVGHFVVLPIITVYAFWFLLAGLVLLALGCFLKGL